MVNPFPYSCDQGRSGLRENMTETPTSQLTEVELTICMHMYIVRPTMNKLKQYIYRAVSKCIFYVFLQFSIAPTLGKNQLDSHRVGATLDTEVCSYDCNSLQDENV